MQRRCRWAAARRTTFPITTRMGAAGHRRFRLFEKICLEGFQSGLSWLTILRKREKLPQRLRRLRLSSGARFKEKDVARLLADAGIVRHRGKIESTINNAARAIELEREAGSLAAYFWRFEPHAKSRPKVLDLATLRAMATTPESVALSKDLKKRGWSFVGPTTVYAFMQAWVWSTTTSMAAIAASWWRRSGGLQPPRRMTGLAAQTKRAALRRPS